LFLVLFALALAYDNEELVKVVNRKNAGWRAGSNKFLRDKTNEEVRALFGWKKELELPLPGTSGLRALPAEAIPSQFTAAANWPKCKTISTIYDQARCGSCWAFAGVEAAMDRFCIFSIGAFNQALSFGNLVECDTLALGCQGGTNYAVWSYLQNPGIVTDACYPYYVPTCEPSQQPCLNFVPTPECWTNSTCVNGAPWTLYQVNNSYSLSGVQAIQTEIMTNGPVSACFSVYEDFLSYKSGVYQYTTGSYLGGHCIKIQGWGVDQASGLPYWLCNNQWTTAWGDKGQFKILRGQDECGIEDDVAAGTPQPS